MAYEFQESASSSSGDTEAGSSAFAGVDVVAQAIDSVLCRVRVTLVDTVVRLEVADGDVGKALELHIAHIEFYDQFSKTAGEDSTSYWESPAFMTKVFTAGGPERPARFGCYVCLIPQFVYLQCTIKRHGSASPLFIAPYTRT